MENFDEDNSKHATEPLVGEAVRRIEGEYKQSRRNEKIVSRHVRGNFQFRSQNSRFLETSNQI